MTTVAIMQPYFYPYAGYFRLFSRADVFVIYDCVQFPRRGWVHRNRLCAADGSLQWLTLRLAYAPQDTLIGEMRLEPGAMAQLESDLGRFPALRRAPPEVLSRLPVFGGQDDLVDYLEANLRAVLDLLGVTCEIRRSSELAVDPALRAQDRILEIASRLGATRYVNSPGGRELYDAAAFKARGIELAFLEAASGPGTSMLERLCSEEASAIRREVVEQRDPH